MEPLRTREGREGRGRAGYGRWRAECANRRLLRQPLTPRRYASLAGLTSLVSLTLSGANGDNARLAPLAALTGLTGMRVELALGFSDSDPGPLAALPALRSLGW